MERRARAARGLPALASLPMLFAPLFAILLPLQTNFEHQKINALLLAFIAGATVQLLARLGDRGWSLHRRGRGAESVSSAAHRLLVDLLAVGTRCARGDPLRGGAFHRAAAGSLRLRGLH